MDLIFYLIYLSGLTIKIILTISLVQFFMGKRSMLEKIFEIINSKKKGE